MDTDHLIQLATAAFVVIGAVINLYTARQAKITATMATKTEVNSNSLMAALRVSDKAASHAEGLEQGRVEGIATAATLAQGREAERTGK